MKWDYDQYCRTLIKQHFVGTPDSGEHFDSHLKVYEGTSPHTHRESSDRVRVVSCIELRHSNFSQRPTYTQQLKVTVSNHLEHTSRQRAQE